MNKNSTLITAVIFSILLYFLDSVFFWLLHETDINFVRALFPLDPVSEMYSRLIMIAGVIILGILLQAKANQQASKLNHNKPGSEKSDRTSPDSSFLKSLSFHLSTPLNAILGFSELLNKPDVTPEFKQIYISQINSSSKGLALLVSNLSELVRIESEDNTIDKKDTLIAKVIEDVFYSVTSRKEEMGKSHISLIIENDKADQDLSFITDASKLSIVLNNLLDNAFSQTERGNVKLGYTIIENKNVEFYVKDSSMGISQKYLDTILENCKRIADISKYPFNSTGMRLSISKNLVMSLGGKLSAESILDQGVRIFFTLPLNKEEKIKVQTVRPVNLDGIKRKWSKHSILIAEDIESNFIYLQELLRPTEIKIYWAKNGVDAVSFAKSQPDVKLVFMDILMPVMDGFEAAREIRKLYPKLPIIAQTAYIIEEEERKEDVKNFSGYLIKPIWAPQLFKIMDQYIG